MIGVKQINISTLLSINVSFYFKYSRFPSFIIKLNGANADLNSNVAFRNVYIQNDLADYLYRKT